MGEKKPRRTYSPVEVPVPIRRGELSPDEYQRWYTPAQVLDALPAGWGLDTKKRVVAKSLEDGLLRSAAHQVVLAGETLTHFELPAAVWPHWACLADHDFWSAGLRIVHSDQRDYHGPRLAAHRVRLEPNGVAALAPGEMSLPARKISREEQQAKNVDSWEQLFETLRPTLELAAKNVARLQSQGAPLELTAAAAARPSRIPPPYAAQRRAEPGKPKRVSKDELRQWFPTYEAVSNDFRFGSVQRAAAAHFGPRPVTRQPLRDIIGEFERTRTRGKPAT